MCRCLQPAYNAPFGLPRTREVICDLLLFAVPDRNPGVDHKRTSWLLGDALPNKASFHAVTNNLCIARDVNILFFLIGK
jgi:hypothetical protein